MSEREELAEEAWMLALLQDEVYNATDRLSRSETRAVVHAIFNGDWLAAYEEKWRAEALAPVLALADEWAAEGDEMSHWFAAQVLYNLIDQARAAAGTPTHHTTEEDTPVTNDAGWTKEWVDVAAVRSEAATEALREVATEWESCGCRPVCWHRVAAKDLRARAALTPAPAPDDAEGKG